MEDKDKSLTEFYNYLNTLDDVRLSRTIRRHPTKKLSDYFVYNYLKNNISMKDIENIITATRNKYKYDVYHFFLVPFIEITQILHNQGKDITNIILSFYRVGKLYDIDHWVSTVTVLIDSNNITYDEFKNYIDIGINLLEDEMISSLLVLSHLLSDKDFEERLRYYVRYGLTYQYIFNSIVLIGSEIPSTNSDGYEIDKAIAVYLLNTRKVSIKSIYNRNIRVKEFLDPIILDQV